MASFKEVDRFWRNTVPEPNTGCLLWIGSANKAGYGKFGFRCMTWLAHRFSWYLEKGSIPQGMFVCHKCDTPSCVNPKHLFIGTPRDNTLDCISKNRFQRAGNGIKLDPSKAARGTRSGMFLHPEKHLHGERSPMSKLTDGDVLEIRSMSDTSMGGRREIGLRLGIHEETVRKILARERWTHI